MASGNETPEQPQTDHAACCMVGAGPAGVMLGFLLARAGVEALVLEKRKDFFRDFRGDITQRGRYFCMSIWSSAFSIRRK